MQSSRPSLVLVLYYVYAPTPSPPPHSHSSRPVVHSFVSVPPSLIPASISTSCFSLPGWVLQPQSRRFEEDFRYFPLELRGS